MEFKMKTTLKEKVHKWYEHKKEERDEKFKQKIIETASNYIPILKICENLKESKEDKTNYN